MTSGWITVGSREDKLRRHQKKQNTAKAFAEYTKKHVNLYNVGNGGCIKEAKVAIVCPHCRNKTIYATSLYPRNDDFKYDIYYCEKCEKWCWRYNHKYYRGI